MLNGLKSDYESGKILINHTNYHPWFFFVQATRFEEHNYQGNEAE